MKGVYVIISIYLMLLNAGCTSITVKHDFDLDANFINYSTFDWMAQPKERITDISQAYAQNPLLEKRVKNAVDQELVAKGLQKQLHDPDFLIAYHTGVEDRLNVHSWGYSYGRGPHRVSYYGDRDVSVMYYKEGTLIIDFIDFKTKQLIWRGWAVGVVNDIGIVGESPKKINEKINSVVKKILDKYPPQ
jgi:hypothetical protein